MGILTSRGLALLLQLGLLAIIGRTIGVAGLGVYQLFVSWLMVIGMLGAFGAPMQALRDISIATARADSNQVTQAFWANMKAAGVGVIALATLLALASPSLQAYLPGAAPDYLLLLAAAGAVLHAALKTLAEALKGAGRPEIGIFLESGFVPATVLLYAAVAAWQGTISIAGLLAAHIFGLTLAVGAATFFWFSRPGHSNAREVQTATRNSRITFGLTQSLAIVANNLPILLMPFFLDADAIGLFAAASKLVNLAAVVLVTLSAYFAPDFARHFTNHDASALSKGLRASQLYSLLLYAPLFLVYVAFPKATLGFFGPGFQEASQLLIILSVGQLLNAATGLVGFFLNMIHLERQELSSMAFALVGFFAATMLLAPAHGARGVAYATAGFMVAKNAISWLRSRAALRDLAARWTPPGRPDV